MEIEIKSTIEKSRFRKFWVKKFFMKPSTWLFYGLMFLLNMLAVFDFVPFFLGFFGVLGAVLLPVFILFKVQKMFSANPFFKELMTFVFREDDLSISYQDRSDSYKYADLHKIEVEGEFMLVYLNQLVAFYVDVEAISLQDPSGELHNFLSKSDLDYSSKS